MDNRFKFLDHKLRNPKWKFKHKPKAHPKVNNCEDAAYARGINVDQELKSLVLNINDILYAFHFRGNEKLNERLINKYFKDVLKVKIKKLRFARKYELKTLNSKDIWEYITFLKKEYRNKYIHEKYLNVFGDSDSNWDIQIIKNGYKTLLVDKNLIKKILNNKHLWNTQKFIIPVQSGTVTPLNENIWNLYTFISPTLLNNEIVYTNDGALNGQISFNPNLLKITPKNNYKEKNIFQFTMLNVKSMSKYAHKAWHGTLDIIDPENLEKDIAYWTNVSFEEGFHKSDSLKYKYLRIMDTFFSDTFDSKTLIQLIEKSKDKDLEYEIQIILLNPFTEIATNRGQALKNENKIYRLNRGLYKIKKAILGEDIIDPDKEFRENSSSPEYIYKQIEQIEEFKKIEAYENLEIRFNKQINYPLYAISQFMFTTQYLIHRSTKNNKWQLYVDDPNKESDYYDDLRIDFETTWTESKPLLPSELVRDFNERNVFISYGQDYIAKAQVMEYVNNYSDFNSVYFEKVQADDETQKVDDIIKKMYKTCASSIHILTKDDKLKSGQERARQNVILELGYSQKAYGSRVLVVAEDGVEIPSNLSGYKLSSFSRDSKGNPRVEEVDIIKFLQRVERNLNK